MAQSLVSFFGTRHFYSKYARRIEIERQEVQIRKSIDVWFIRMADVVWEGPIIDYKTSDRERTMLIHSHVVDLDIPKVVRSSLISESSLYGRFWLKSPDISEQVTREVEHYG